MSPSDGEIRRVRFRGGQAPLGYRRDRTGRLRPVPREAALVRLLFRDYLRLSSLGALANSLKRQRLAHRGQPWSRQALLWILRNDVYRGVLRKGGAASPIPGAHPAIVSSAAFMRVQRVLESRRRSPGWSAQDKQDQGVSGERRVDALTLAALFKKKAAALA